MSNKHIATLPDGTIAKRTSANRVYPYCVAVRVDYQNALRWAKQLVRVDHSNFNYHKAYLDGTSRWLERTKWESDEAYAARVAKEKAKADAEVGDCADAEAYQKKLIAKRIASVEEAKANGYYDKWQVSGWCGRYDLAVKQAAALKAKEFYSDAVIVTTNFA